MSLEERLYGKLIRIEFKLKDYKALDNVYSDCVESEFVFRHGDTLVSPNCQYALRFQWDNLLTIRRLSDDRLMWSTSPNDQYRMLDDNAYLMLQNDGCTNDGS